MYLSWSWEYEEVAWKIEQLFQLVTLLFAGEGRKRSQLALPGSSEIVLGGHEVDLTNMIAVMKTPTGSSEPCLLKKTPTGQLSQSSHWMHLVTQQMSNLSPFVRGRYWSICVVIVTGLASFSPKTKGKYTVDVTQDGKPVKGSPFSINVSQLSSITRYLYTCTCVCVWCQISQIMMLVFAGWWPQGGGGRKGQGRRPGHQDRRG